jgi:RNA recognition motif-containing protein
MVDRESSRSKGFGFVTFEDATNADQLVGKLGLTIDDKEVLRDPYNAVPDSYLYVRSKSKWHNPGANAIKDEWQMDATRQCSTTGIREPRLRACRLLILRCQ